MSHKYSIQVVWSEEDALFLASVPELPGCIADGGTREQAIENLDTVVSEWIETAQSLGREIPPPVERATQEKMWDQFRAQVQEHIKSEVEKAVQRVLQLSAGSGFRVIAGNQIDPCDWWKQHR